jgi:hypothetical protein
MMSSFKNLMKFCHLLTRRLDEKAVIGVKLFFGAEFSG